MSKKTKKYKLILYKEIVFAVLAVLSVATVFLEIFMELDSDTISRLYKFDIFVALLFLTDFFFYFSKANNRLLYMRKNWFLLLASIPILESWAELLRGLRILELVRLVRAGEHLTVSYKNVNHKKSKR